MQTYPFLTLSILFLLPGAAIYLFRADLRGPLWRMGLASVPFATTEFLFYPDYWQPRTLFDLVPRIGFGIEDVLFVLGLGLLCTGVYPAVTGRIFSPRSPGGLLRRACFIAIPTVGLVVAAALGGIHMIYAAPVIMFGVGIAVMTLRRDLIWPGLMGMALVTLVYAVLSLIFARLIPGVFDLAWNTDRFLNRFVLGIPVEELVYGAAAGLIGSICYPFVTGSSFQRRPASDSVPNRT